MDADDFPLNKETAGLIGGEQSIELFAGQHPNGEIIIERVLVSALKKANSYQILKSPVFVRGIARADVIQKMDAPKGAFKMLQNGGNLCVRVFSRKNLSPLELVLTPEFEKLDGDLDVKEPNALVYTIHVSSGFNTIEEILNKQIEIFGDAAWFYGNVYDPESGDPLDWWQAILAAE